MGNPAGSFIWYELMTSDADAAMAFYGAVVGWAISPRVIGAEPDYRHITRRDGGHNGGVLQITPEIEARGVMPAWFPYLSVTDVDRAVKEIVADGGHKVMEMTIPEGHIALVSDPQSVPFYVMAPVPPADRPDAASDVFSPTEPQHVRWNELASPNLAAARSFYSRHFGFAFNNSMPMGPLGDYCFIEHHGQVLGAIMQQPEGSGPALWLPYIGVPSIAVAKAALESHGGTVLAGPMEVPGGDWIVVATDPQGARFGLVGPKGE